MKTVSVLGPATQDCLKQTVVDARKIGFQVIVLEDAIRTGRAADNYKEIAQAGAPQVTTFDLGIASV